MQSLTPFAAWSLEQRKAVQKLEELELKHIETNGQLLQLEQQTNTEKKISKEAPEKPLKDLEKLLGFFMFWWKFKHALLYFKLPQTNITPENGSSQKANSVQTINFQGRAVSF